MNRRLASILLAGAALMSCSLPTVSIATPTLTPSPATPPTDTALPPLPTAALGLAENPVILALPPGPQDQAKTEAARALADQFNQRTGHVVVTVAPDSYAALVEALRVGNAHLVLLNPLSYALAQQEGLVQAEFALVQDHKIGYGAQFLATRQGKFQTYFNDLAQVNTAEAGEALAQFADKKPCWSDEFSPSGYVVPLGYLKANQVSTRPAAFVQGHPTVVRSLYAGGICDFGATYVDARKFPSLEDQYPDLMEQVILVWRIPDIIPYGILAFSTGLPPEMREQFDRAFLAILQTEAGKSNFKTVYDIDALQPVNDADFAEFLGYVRASGVALEELVK